MDGASGQPDGAENMNVSIGDLKNIFEGQSLDGLFVTGYIDEGSSLPGSARPRCHFGQFHALWDEVYLEVGKSLLRFSAIDAYSKLRMEQVERIGCSLDIDPDDTFGVMSVLRILLPSGRESARVKQLDVYTNPNAPHEPGIVTALGLSMDDDEYLFFDPQDAINGIHIGSMQSRELWCAWRGGQYALDSHPVGV